MSANTVIKNSVTIKESVKLGLAGDLKKAKPKIKLLTAV